MSLWEVISHPGQHATGLGKAALSKLVAFRELIDRFAAVATEKDAFETGREIVKESGLYAELYKNLDPESVSKQENLEEFLAAMQAFVEEGKETGDQVMLADYLQEVALITDQDRKDDDTPKVKLMTVHASKGLEFANVFVVGLEENIFPLPWPPTRDADWRRSGACSTSPSRAPSAAASSPTPKTASASDPCSLTVRAASSTTSTRTI